MEFTLAIVTILVVVAGAVTYVDAHEMGRDEATAQVELTATLRVDSLSLGVERMPTQTRTLSACELLTEGN